MRSRLRSAAIGLILQKWILGTIMARATAEMTAEYQCSVLHAQIAINFPLKGSTLPTPA